ncbi:hypothetical protein [Synoicihabitans lomoniglobus]|uniref:Uncharacterized protein n=1 Tax=Synoicihabitans lomoniglobus TaxID=2909285 RepID=A0AAF0CPT1_9BACT|nr:hypothetical protein [Opitutaceae bacterium LMO-M01]WED65828.1 hypothetical protein PXH66_03070 [Opitutaceae bacterium LMO-M01]
MHTVETRSTYGERYCRAHHIPSELFLHHVAARSLHAPLRWFWPFFKVSLADYLDVDLDCIRIAATLKSHRDLEDELVEFSYHPRNQSFFRRVLRQRLSTHRLRRVLRGASAGTSSPFSARGSLIKPEKPKSKD